MKRIGFFILLFIFAFTLTSCSELKDLLDFTKNPEIETTEDERNHIYELAVSSGYKGTYEEWLASIKGDQIVLRVDNGYIQWSYSTSRQWNNLISVDEIKGADGKNPEFRVYNGYIQWKYTSSGNWVNLVNINELSGNDGKTAEFRMNNGYMQWKYTDEDDSAWRNLFKAPDGVKEIYNITFDYGDGVTKVVEVEKGSAIPKPEDPVVEGCKFLGWYVNGKEWEFDFYAALKPMTLTAMYSKRLVVSFVTGTSEVISNQIFSDMDSLELRLPYLSQIKEGYKFTGWVLEGNETYTFNQGDVCYIPTEAFYEDNWVFKARWEEIPNEPIKVYVGAESVQIYQTLLNDYVEDNNLPIEIDVTGVDTGSYTHNFINDPKNGADIFVASHDSLAILGSSIAPITKQSLINNMEDTVDSVLLDVWYMSVDGQPAKYYGAPFSRQSLVLYYNKDLFSGSNANKISSWEGILDVATATNKLATAYVGDDGYSYSLWLLAKPSNAKAKAAFGDRGTLQLYKGGLANACYAWGEDQILIHTYAQQFTQHPNGRNGSVIGSEYWNSLLQRNAVCTVVAGPWNRGQVEQTWGPDGYSVAPLPTFTIDGYEFRSGSFYDTRCLVKNKYSNYSTYLDDIIEYLTSDDVQTVAYYETGNLPASNNVSINEEDELARAQMEQGRLAGTPQPFGYNQEFNPNYYLKSTSYALVFLHEGRASNSIERTLQLVSYTWATGNTYNNNLDDDILNNWINSR